MHTKHLAIIEIVLGALVIAAFMCPSSLSNIVLGAMVIAFGIVLLVRPILRNKT
jgi:hypothetical protein